MSGASLDGKIGHCRHWTREKTFLDLEQVNNVVRSIKIAPRRKEFALNSRTDDDALVPTR